MSKPPIIQGLEYPLCDKEFTDDVCVGVIGGYQDAQQCDPKDLACKNFVYGASSTLMSNLAKFDSDVVCGSTIDNAATNLAFTDSSGTCHPCIAFQGQCANQGKVSSTNLVVNDASLKVGVTKSTASTFELQTLHKVWGQPSSGPVYNQGVNSQNVYISPTQVSVKCGNQALDTLFGVSSQNVIVCEAHGNQYTGPIMGLKKGAKTDSPLAQGGIPMPKAISYDNTSDGKYVGGVVATRKAYGPGVYNVLAYTPSLPNDELGYVFAIWPFHYSEVYNNNPPDPPSTQARGPLGPSSDDMQTFPCFSQCDTDANPATITPKCPTCNYLAPGETDPYDVINHEIDIEIPANVNFANSRSEPSSTSQSASNRGVDTMNFNTWVNDIDNYDMDTGAYYQNLGVRAPSGTTFVSTDNAWHWYTIEWSVDNDDFTNNYVSIYFDDPFDPTCTATHNNVNLPSAPRGKPLATTKRFVPTRAGRLNIGPWFGWWGFNVKGNDQPTPYDTMGIGLAHISIAPQATPQGTSGFGFAQSFDQSYVDTSGKLVPLEPDFADFYSKGPQGPPSTTKMSDFFPSYQPTSGQPGSCTPRPPPPPPPPQQYYYCDSSNMCAKMASGTGPYTSPTCDSGCQAPTKFVCTNNSCVSSSSPSATSLEDCQKACATSPGNLSVATIIGIVCGVLVVLLIVVLVIYFVLKKRKNKVP